MRRILFAIIGSISVILSIVCFCKDVGRESSYSFYGGDAFTGIQQAGAQTSNNVTDLAKVTRFGFGSILLISGMVLISLAVPCTEKTNQIVKENNANREVETNISVEKTDASE